MYTRWGASLVAPGIMLGAGGESGRHTNVFAALGLGGVVSLGGSYGQSPTYGEGRFLRHSPNYYMREPVPYDTPAKYYGYRSPYDSGTAYLGGRFAGGLVDFNAGFQIRFPDITIGSRSTYPTPQALDPPPRGLLDQGWEPHQRHTSGPELQPGVSPVTMRYMPAGRPPEWKTTQQQVTGVDLIRQPELTLNAGDVTRRAQSTISSAPAANDPNWEQRVYGGYMGIPGMHIGNS